MTNGIRIVRDMHNTIHPISGNMVFSGSEEQEISLIYQYDCESGYSCEIKFIPKPNANTVIKGFELVVNCGCGKKHGIKMGSME